MIKRIFYMMVIAIYLFKRYYKYLLPCFLLCCLQILMCCSKKDFLELDDLQDAEKKQFTVEAYFNYSNSQYKKYPDVGAEIYIYFDVPTYKFSNADYLGNGIYNKMGEIIEPDSSYIIDADGCKDIEYRNLKDDLTIIVESRRMKSVYSFYQYSPLNPPTKIIVLFTIPEC